MRTTNYQLNTPCAIALLTDVHNAPWQPIAQKLASPHPDMICIAGDLFYGDSHSSLQAQTNILPLLSACTEIAPTFFSIGNHDWILKEEDLDVIRNTGVTVLDNAWITLDLEKPVSDSDRTNLGDNAPSLGIDQTTLGAGPRTPDSNHTTPGSNTRLVIGGLTSGIALKLRVPGWETNPAAPMPRTDWLQEFEREPGYKILLCHHPEYFYALQNRPIDLILSGHAHGGQWRLFNRGLFAPGQGLFPKLTSGVHSYALPDGAHASMVSATQSTTVSDSRGHMVISRGLSNTTYVPRINNPTEIVFIS